ncbi:MAG: hypothetical protein MJ214_01130 [Bacilli bacterium]|mgnify:FL=1|nr:hypothetical protein [Bacilli bacterium]
MQYEIRYYFDQECLKSKRVCFREVLEGKSKADAESVADQRLARSAFGFTCYEILELI